MQLNMPGRMMIVLALLFGVKQAGNTQETVASQPPVKQQAYVEQLRLENRLPDWANYVCYQDAKNFQTGLFMLIGYRPATSDPFFPNDSKGAKEFGYSRGLTYQEYIGSDTDVTPINMPISPEEYAEERSKALQAGPGSLISLELLAMFDAQSVAVNNAIAVTKSTIRGAATYPDIEEPLLKDEEVQALLDAPDGTNYHNYLKNHPGYFEISLIRQKYYDARIIDPPGGFKIYREGNVIFESVFGLGVFEPAASIGKIGGGEKSGEGGLTTRIEMEDTASGLRFLQSHALGGSAIGIPITGKCDPIKKQ